MEEEDEEDGVGVDDEGVGEEDNWFEESLPLVVQEVEGGGGEVRAEVDTNEEDREGEGGGVSVPPSATPPPSFPPSSLWRHIQAAEKAE